MIDVTTLFQCNNINWKPETHNCPLTNPSHYKFQYKRIFTVGCHFSNSSLSWFFEAIKILSLTARIQQYIAYYINFFSLLPPSFPGFEWSVSWRYYQPSHDISSLDIIWGAVLTGVSTIWQPRVHSSANVCEIFHILVTSFQLLGKEAYMVALSTCAGF